MGTPTAERFIEEMWRRVDERDKNETLRAALDIEVRKIVWAGQRMRQNFFGRCGNMNSIKEWDALINAAALAREKEPKP
jgi:hypothetical protein